VADPGGRAVCRGTAAARLLELQLRISTGVWMFVCCERCVLSDRFLCVGLITHPDESYRVWCVWVCSSWSWKLLSVNLASRFEFRLRGNYEDGISAIRENLLSSDKLREFERTE